MAGHPGGAGDRSWIRLIPASEGTFLQFRNAQPVAGRAMPNLDMTAAFFGSNSSATQESAGISLHAAFGIEVGKGDHMTAACSSAPYRHRRREVERGRNAFGKSSRQTFELLSRLCRQIVLEKNLDLG
jgi:hypothetical protein